MTDLSRFWGDWAAYFRALNAELNDEAPTDEPKILLQPMMPTLLSSAPAGPKRMYARLEQAGWETWMECSVVRLGRTFYKGTDRAGEVKSEPQEVRFWQVRGRRRHEGQMVAAFQGIWEQKKTCAFMDAFYWDVVTGDKELFTKLKDMEDWLAILAPAPGKKAA